MKCKLSDEFGAAVVANLLEPFRPNASNSTTCKSIQEFTTKPVMFGFTCGMRQCGSEPAGLGHLYLQLSGEVNLVMSPCATLYSMAKTESIPKPSTSHITAKLKQAAQAPGYELFYYRLNAVKGQIYWVPAGFVIARRAPSDAR